MIQISLETSLEIEYVFPIYAYISHLLLVAFLVGHVHLPDQGSINRATVYHSSLLLFLELA